MIYSSVTGSLSKNLNWEELDIYIYIMYIWNKYIRSVKLVQGSGHMPTCSPLQRHSVLGLSSPGKMQEIGLILKLKRVGCGDTHTSRTCFGPSMKLRHVIGTPHKCVYLSGARSKRMCWRETLCRPGWLFNYSGGNMIQTPCNRFLVWIRRMRFYDMRNFEESGHHVRLVRRVRSSVCLLRHRRRMWRPHMCIYVTCDVCLPRHRRRVFSASRRSWGLESAPCHEAPTSCHAQKCCAPPWNLQPPSLPLSCSWFRNSACWPTRFCHPLARSRWWRPDWSTVRDTRRNQATEAQRLLVAYELCIHVGALHGVCCAWSWVAGSSLPP